jgi:Domain of unknown function (DUF4282)
MAFCAQCGGQLTPGAAACSACGAATGAAPAAAAAPAPARYAPPINTQQAAGFISSLFDLSFTTFITPKLIKVLFILSIVFVGLGALGLVGSAFMSGGAIAGIFVLLIVAPLFFLFEVIIARVWMEVLIQLFRSCDYLAEIAKQGRR